MDTVCRAIHQKICAEGGLKSYIVLDEDDFLNCLTEEYGFDDVKRAVKTLKDDGCIDVKYCRGNAFCIAALKEPEPAAPPAPAAPEINMPEEIALSGAETTAFGKEKYALIFASSFLGGAAGSLVVSMIFALI